MQFHRGTPLLDWVSLANQIAPGLTLFLALSVTGDSVTGHSKLRSFGEAESDNMTPAEIGSDSCSCRMMTQLEVWPRCLPHQLHQWGRAAQDDGIGTEESSGPKVNSEGWEVFGSTGVVDAAHRQGGRPQKAAHGG